MAYDASKSSLDQDITFNLDFTADENASAPQVGASTDSAAGYFDRKPHARSIFVNDDTSRVKIVSHYAQKHTHRVSGLSNTS